MNSGNLAIVIDARDARLDLVAEFQRTAKGPLPVLGVDVAANILDPSAFTSRRSSNRAEFGSNNSLETAARAFHRFGFTSGSTEWEKKET